MSSRSLRRNRRAAAAGALAATLGFAGLGLASAPAGATADFDLERLAGADRIETAVEISQDTFTSATTALIGRADLYPDALAGNYLAGAEQGPILLSHTDEVPAETLAELERLGVTDVVLLGGTAALSADVEAALTAEGFTVSREAGTDRYKTAAEIATSQAAAGIGEVDGARTAILATGERFPDALTGGPLAYAGMHPILLTPTASLGADAAGALEALEIEHVIILGGTAAVSQAAEDAVEAAGMTTERLAGATRYSTATEIAEWAIANAGFSDTHVDVATGQNFPDALTGGPHAGENTAPIILANEGNTAEAEAFLESIADTVAEGHIFGGTAAVSAAVEAALEAAGQAVVGQSGVVTAVVANSYTFTDSATGTEVTVNYDSTNDTFTVDGAPASELAFEGQIGIGDQIRFVDDPSTTTTADADAHHLTNVDTSKLASGTVGNVDLVNEQYDIIDPVSGVALRSNVDYTGDVVYVDGGVVNTATFSAAINEGDTIVIDTDAALNETHRLTNQAVKGSLTSEAGDLITINKLGDDPTDAANDATYNTGLAGSTFTVDGVAKTKAEFLTAATIGDEVTHTRNAGVQTFALVNKAPASSSGQATDDLDTGNDTLTLANGATDVAIDYTGVGTYRVNGVVVSEPEAEGAITPGDDITFTPDNPDTAANDGVLSVTNRTLEGLVLNVDTVNGQYDVANSAGNILAVDVDYDTAPGYFGGANRYFVNNTEVDLATFNSYLTKVGADATPDDTIQVVDSNTATTPPADLSTDHRLTTDETLP